MEPVRARLKATVVARVWGYKEREREELKKKKNRDTKLGVDNENDPIVITTMVGNCEVKRILIDNSSAVEILSYSTFKMRLSEEDLGLAKPIYSFVNKLINVMR
ncbi:hypothetical protein PTKIN_Ptkin09bG0172800 [Pterospermum kingtungense]